MQQFLNLFIFASELSPMFLLVYLKLFSSLPILIFNQKVFSVLEVLLFKFY